MFTLPVSRRRSAARLTAAAIGLNLLWRAVRYALGFPIWGDEAFVAVNLLTRDFRGMTAPLEYDRSSAVHVVRGVVQVRCRTGRILAPPLF
jgi:hypothetical protein